MLTLPWVTHNEMAPENMELPEFFLVRSRCCYETVVANQDPARQEIIKMNRWEKLIVVVLEKDCHLKNIPISW